MVTVLCSTGNSFTSRTSFPIFGVITVSNGAKPVLPKLPWISYTRTRQNDYTSGIRIIIECKPLRLHTI